MKKIFALLIALVMMFVGCQKVEQTINKEQREFTSYDGMVKITVDADVIKPDCDIPVVLIEPDEISLEFVENAVAVFMEGKTLYEPQIQLIKSEIESKINQLQLAIDYPEQSNSDGLRSNDPEHVAEVTEMFENRIKIFESIYNDAPDEYIKKQAIIEFKPSKYYEEKQSYIENVADWSGSEEAEVKDLFKQYEKEMQIILDANLENGHYGQLTAANFTGDLWRWNEFSFIKAKELHEVTHSPSLLYYNDFSSHLTEEDAKIMMTNLLEELGIDNMSLTSFGSFEKKEWNKEGDADLSSFYGIFQRNYYSVPTACDLEMSEFVDLYSDRPSYKRELLKIRIAYDEIVEFIWVSPSKEVSIETDDVEILPFAEIMDIFQKNMTEIYDAEKISRDAPDNDDHEEYVSNIETGFINISRIELSLERVPVRGDKSLYKMIPVWKFYGSEELKIKGQDFFSNNMPESEFAYLTINAIDGSIIDRSIGY